MSRIFFLSPAKSSGQRARMLTRPEASFELARRVQIGDATLGEVFSFCSGLYFRGKLTYARRFANPLPRLPGIHVITPSRGLISPDTSVGLEDLRHFSTVPVDAAEPLFTQPLIASATRILSDDPGAEIVLLGSIATGKYLDVLLPIFGDRLLFPAEFPGRGDMSRGGLLLRCAALGQELQYVPAATAARRGPRATRIDAMMKPRISPATSPSPPIALPKQPSRDQATPPAARKTAAAPRDRKSAPSQPARPRRSPR